MLNKSAGSTVSTGSNNRVMCIAHGACKWGLIVGFAQQSQISPHERRPTFCDATVCRLEIATQLLCTARESL